MVALRSMFLQLLHLHKLLHISAYDFVSINTKSFISFVFGLLIGCIETDSENYIGLICQITDTNGGWGLWDMMFNATFNNISAISWRLVLLVEKTGVA